MILLPPEEDEDDEQARELAEKEAEYQRNPPYDNRALTDGPNIPAVNFNKKSLDELALCCIRPVRVLTSNQPGSRPSCSLHMMESLFSWSALSCS